MNADQLAEKCISVSKTSAFNRENLTTAGLYGLGGAGVGALAGYLKSKTDPKSEGHKKRTARDVLVGGLLGAATGGATGYGLSRLSKGDGGISDALSTVDRRQEIADKFGIPYDRVGDLVGSPLVGDAPVKEMVGGGVAGAIYDALRGGGKARELSRQAAIFTDQGSNLSRGATAVTGTKPGDAMARAMRAAAEKDVNSVLPKAQNQLSPHVAGPNHPGLRWRHPKEIVRFLKDRMDRVPKVQSKALSNNMLTDAYRKALETEAVRAAVISDVKLTPADIERKASITMNKLRNKGIGGQRVRPELISGAVKEMAPGTDPKNLYAKRVKVPGTIPPAVNAPIRRSIGRTVSRVKSPRVWGTALLAGILSKGYDSARASQAFGVAP